MKKAIIIGATKPGYAVAITKKFINEGVFVIGTYNDDFLKEAEELQNTYGANQARFVKMDPGTRESLFSFIDSIKEPIDGIIYSHFYFEMEDPTQTNHEVWDRSIAENLTAPNILLRELKKRMNPGSSNIILTSTEAYRGSYGAPSYTMTKAAVHNLVKSLANLMGKEQIRVNAIPAGWIGGVMDTDEIFNQSRALTPLGRLGTAEEIAAVAYFLFSEQSSFINGTTIIADGGYLCSDSLAKYEFTETFK